MQPCRFCSQSDASVTPLVGKILQQIFFGSRFQCNLLFYLHLVAIVAQIVVRWFFFKIKTGGENGVKEGRNWGRKSSLLKCQIQELKFLNSGTPRKVNFCTFKFMKYYLIISLAF